MKEQETKEIILFEFRRRNLKNREAKKFFRYTIENFDDDSEFKIIETKLPLHDNLDSDKILLFVDPDNKKVWIWFGKNITVRQSFNSAKSAQGIINKYRIEFNKNKKIPRINNAIKSFTVTSASPGLQLAVIKTKFINVRLNNKTCSSVIEGKEPIDFKIMLGYLPNMNDIEDEEEFEKRIIGFPNRIRNEDDVIEDKVFIHKFFLRWEELANETMKILNKIKDLDEKYAKLMDRKKVGENVKDLRKLNKKEFKRLGKKEKKIYFKMIKVSSFEGELYDYVICPNCRAINRKRKPIPDGTIGFVCYPMPPPPPAKPTFFCHNCGYLLFFYFG